MTISIQPPSDRREYLRQWQRDNRDKVAANQRRYKATSKGKKTVRRSRLKKYGLTPEEWDRLFEKQGRVCAVCSEGEGPWHTDHCHSTGRVRGILCRPCNIMLGHARDRKDILAKAISYLQ